MDNQRNYWVWWVVVIIIILVIAGVWMFRSGGTTSQVATSTPPGSTMMLPYGTVTLALGEQGVFQGITITPLSVAEDSRCNVGVQCIQAGTVRVVVRSDLATGTSRQDVMMLGSTTPVDTFTVSLISVTPSPKPSAKVPDQDYRFTFDVHQSGSGVGLQGKG